jgi:hypothetical protein
MTDCPDDIVSMRTQQSPGIVFGKMPFRLRDYRNDIECLFPDPRGLQLSRFMLLVLLGLCSCSALPTAITSNTYVVFPAAKKTPSLV